MRKQDDGQSIQGGRCSSDRNFDSMLNQYLGEDEIASLVDVLESTAFNPSNEALLNQLLDVFAGRGRFYRAPC